MLNAKSAFAAMISLSLLASSGPAYGTAAGAVVDVVSLARLVVNDLRAFANGGMKEGLAKGVKQNLKQPAMADDVPDLIPTPDGFNWARPIDLVYGGSLSQVTGKATQGVGRGHGTYYLFHRATLTNAGRAADGQAMDLVVDLSIDSKNILRLSVDVTATVDRVGFRYFDEAAIKMTLDRMIADAVKATRRGARDRYFLLGEQVYAARHTLRAPVERGTYNDGYIEASVQLSDQSLRSARLFVAELAERILQNVQ